MRKRDIYIFQVFEFERKGQRKRQVILLRVSGRKGNRGISGIAEEEFPAGLDVQSQCVHMKRLLKSLGWRRQALICAVAGDLLTFRLVKLPADGQKELNQMLGLQAAKLMPYSPAELRVAYQVIGKDEKGYSSVSLAIASREGMERIYETVSGAGIDKYVLTATSWGVCALFHYLYPQEGEPVVIIECDGRKTEIVIAAEGKLLLSRTFNLPADTNNWLELLSEQIQKTKAVYRKESSLPWPERIYVMGHGEIVRRSCAVIEKSLGCSVNRLPYEEILPAVGDAREQLKTAVLSLGGMCGLGIAVPPEEECFFSAAERAARGVKISRIRHVRLAALAILLAGIFLIGTVLYLQRRQVYAAELENLVSEKEKEALRVKSMQEKTQFLQAHLDKNLTVLDSIKGLHESIPAETMLTELTIEEDRRFVLRGQSSKFSSVMEFAQRLRKHGIFKGFDVRVSYARKQQKQASESVGFEIICTGRE